MHLVAMTIKQENHMAGLQRGQGLMAVGGLLGALVASSCCLLPLVLFGLGVSGAWIGNLTRFVVLWWVAHIRIYWTRSLLFDLGTIAFRSGGVGGGRPFHRCDQLSLLSSDGKKGEC